MNRTLKCCFSINTHMQAYVYINRIYLLFFWMKKADKPHCQHFCCAKASLRLSALLGGARYQLQQKPNVNVRLLIDLALPTGLEPVTLWLTVRCSANWAMEEYGNYSVYYQFWILVFSSFMLNFPGCFVDGCPANWAMRDYVILI